TGWVLPPDQGILLRNSWSTAYARAAADDIYPMAQRFPVARDFADQFSYPKGALLMTALEDRIGRDKMVAALRRFVADNRGRAGSWGAIVAAVRAEAGNEAATWLDTWLHQAGAPRLQLKGIARARARVTGTLTQGTPAFPGSVQLGFQ